MDKQILELKRLLKNFFPVAWMGHIGIGLTYGMMGPAQPFLANQVEVDHASIALLWTSRAAGVTLACLTSGQSFGSEWMKSSRWRLLFLGVAQIIISLCLLSIPFVTNYFLLLTIFLVMTFGLGSFDVADNGLMNMMLGPELSRPMVQSLHAFVAVGFTSVAFLMPLFLPESSSTSEEICAKLRGDPLAWDQIQEEELVQEDEYSWPILTMPCSIFGLFVLGVALGFFILALKGLELPSFHCPSPVSTTSTDLEKTLPENQDTQQTQNRNTYLILLMSFLFYFLTCGLDTFFQSQTYTFGLCGPLGIGAKGAGWLNISYFSLYLVGRLISIPLSALIGPSTIIVLSLIGAFFASLILIIWGTSMPAFLYLATALMGFCACLQFPSGITWLNSKIPNMTSRQVSVVFMGANAAHCIFPVLASKLFHAYGPISVFYFASVIIVSAGLTFILMTVFGKRCQ